MSVAPKSVCQKQISFFQLVGNSICILIWNKTFNLVFFSGIEQLNISITEFWKIHWEFPGPNYVQSKQTFDPHFLFKVYGNCFIKFTLYLSLQIENTNQIHCYFPTITYNIRKIPRSFIKFIKSTIIRVKWSVRISNEIYNIANDLLQFHLIE